MTKQLSSLQVLRGIAAIMVVLYHATIHYHEHHQRFLHDIFNFGYAGVDIFFVLSGFIIMYSSQKYLSGEYKAGDFLKKRLLRIYPSYWLFLFLPLLVLFVIRPQLFPHPEAFDAGHIGQVFTLMFEHAEISQVTWTLSFEVYFYFLFFLLLLHKKWVWLLVFVSSMAVIDLLVGLDFLQSKLLEDCFSKLNLEFLLGICACWLLMHYRPRKRWVLMLLLTGLGLFFFSGLFMEKEHHDLVKVYRPFYYGLPSMMIILSFAYQEYYSNMFLHNLLKKVGDASYVLYLIHSPLISFLDNTVIFKKHLVLVQPEVTTLLGVLVIVAISICLHQLIERPLVVYLNKRRKTIATIEDIKH